MLRRLSERLAPAVSAAIAALVCAGCGVPEARADGAARSATGVIVMPASSDPTGANSASTPVSLESLVQAAMADAARRSGRPLGSLVVLDAAAVDWPDGAAGCPEPGVEYTQALVPGYRIRIRDGKQVLNYHATRWSGAPMLCPADRVQPALPPRNGQV